MGLCSSYAGLLVARLALGFTTAGQSVLSISRANKDPLLTSIHHYRCLPRCSLLLLHMVPTSHDGLQILFLLLQCHISRYVT